MYLMFCLSSEFYGICSKSSNCKIGFLVNCLLLIEVVLKSSWFKFYLDFDQNFRYLQENKITNMLYKQKYICFFLLLCASIGLTRVSTYYICMFIPIFGLYIQ